MGTPTCLCKQEVGKPSQNTAQLCAKAKGCVHEELRLINCGKAGDFGLVPGTLTHLTEQVNWRIQKLMWHAFKKHDGEVVVVVVVGCRFFGAKGKRYKLFWMGSKQRYDGVGIFIAQKWVDSVVNIKRHSERVLIQKMVYAFDWGKPEEDKRGFWNKLFHLLSL